MMAGDAAMGNPRATQSEEDMKLGLYLRNMGPQSTRSLIAAAARAAEEAGIDDLWVADHLALPPEEAEGSDGRYVEALATLAFLAGITERVSLAVGVLIVPYRPALLTAKWIASIQELSAGRLILGVGVGWMEQEFRALGADPRSRGATTDATLDFLHECFAADEVEANGQKFLFRPRPPRPPILVGGAPPHAIRRAVRFGDGWMPTGAHVKMLEAGIASLREGMAAAGKPAPEVVLLQPLPVEDDEKLAARLRELAAVGITRVVHPWRYQDAEEVARVAARSSPPGTRTRRWPERNDLRTTPPA
jgi:probable F420-dependent oxidoreductase